eukprot:tig00000042_g15401.t1
MEQASHAPGSQAFLTKATHTAHGQHKGKSNAWNAGTPTQKLHSILGSSEVVDRERESALLAIFALADGDELNRLLSRLSLAQLRKLLAKTERLKHTRAALLDIFSAKLSSLSTRSKLAIVKALQHAGLDPLGESLLRDIFVSTEGHELTRLKELVDCGSDGSLDAGFFHRDLHELLFVDVQSEAVREEILTHIWTEGMRLRVAEDAPARRKRRDPDAPEASSEGAAAAGFDDGEWEDVSTVSVPPRPDAASAAAAVFAAPAGSPLQSEGTPSAWVKRGGRRHRHIKIISDIDDTLYVGWKDTKFPRGTVYPGVLDVFAALNYKYEDRHRHRRSPLGILQPRMPSPVPLSGPAAPSEAGSFASASSASSSSWGGWVAGFVGAGIGLSTLGCMATALSGIIQVRSPEEAAAQDVASLVDLLPDEPPPPPPPLRADSAPRAAAEDDPAAAEAEAEAAAFAEEAQVAAEAAEAAAAAGDGAAAPSAGDVAADVAPFSVTFITARPKLVGNLFGKVTRRLLRRKGIANATVLSGSIDAWLTPQRMENKKYFNFVRYRQLYPEFDFVLFGDSGQRDIQLCESLLGRHRPIVAAVLIHDVVAMPPADRGGLRSRGIAVYDTYIGALLEAYQLGLLDQAAPPDAEDGAAAGPSARPHRAVQELLQRTAESTVEQLRAVRFGDAAVRQARVAEHNADIDRLNALLDPDLRLRHVDAAELAPVGPPMDVDSEPASSKHLAVF